MKRAYHMHFDFVFKIGSRKTPVICRVIAKCELFPCLRPPSVLCLPDSLHDEIPDSVVHEQYLKAGGGRLATETLNCVELSDCPHSRGVHGRDGREGQDGRDQSEFFQHLTGTFVGWDVPFAVALVIVLSG